VARRAMCSAHGLWLALCVCCLLLVAPGGAISPAAKAMLRRRHATNAPCSLRTVDALANPYAVCFIESDQGQDKLKRLRVTFGETNCTVRLTKCQKNTCYSMLDVAARIQEDESFLVPKPSPQSIFSQLQVEGAKLTWNRHGFSFVALEPDADVTLTYSTHTCAAFYSTRGRQEQQPCHQPLAALSVLEMDLPTVRTCAHSLPSTRDRRSCSDRACPPRSSLCGTAETTPRSWNRPRD